MKDIAAENYDLPLSLLQSKSNTSVVPLRWEKHVLYLLDQRSLPHEETWLAYSSARDVAQAIRDMVVRGAPAIGITAAFGMVLAAYGLKGKNWDLFVEKWLEEAAFMLQARPTAVNLKWAVERLKKLARRHYELSPGDLAAILEKEAISIWTEDVRANLAIGFHGQALLPEMGGVLTHCNAGGLATGGYGTALGVIRAALSRGKEIKVIADETRPWLQGARLTAWELIKDGIAVTLVVDGAAGSLMQKGQIKAVVVGADRIAANGDVANKIGTYSVAELARANNIPFYVAAPVSTIDPFTPSGDQIPIEERGSGEITTFAGKEIAATGVGVYNPVFDITSHNLVTAIITESGVFTPPYGPSIYACFS
ncbi:MAG TPA: S-methyl-5-thioribose-1-phosphate isomerase [Deltaproteobacteria bacterium]|nr:S-methyl-5-thioribose-1-phosphate isomerase [Deltaproteobacteria bacterium]